MKEIKKFSVQILKRETGQFSKDFHSKVFTLFASSESDVFQKAKDFPRHYKHCFCFLREDHARWFADSNSSLAVRQFIIKNVSKKYDWILRYYNKWLKDWHKFLILDKKADKLDLQKLSDKQLYNLFKNYYELYVKAGGVAYICDSFMSTGKSDWLQELLGKELKKTHFDNFEKIIAELVAPIHLSFTLQEEHDLLALTAKFYKAYGDKLPEFNKLSIAFQKLINRHEQNYHWMRNNYYHVERYSALEIYKKIKKMLSENKQSSSWVLDDWRAKQAYLLKAKKARQQAEKEIELPSKYKNIIKTANLFSKWKDIRKSGVCMGMAGFDKFLGEVGRRANYSKRDLSFVILPEIAGILLRKIDYKDEISKRKQKVFWAVTHKGEYVLSSGADADKFFKFFPATTIAEAGYLYGVAACKGKVAGIVRVIKKTKEMVKFKTGEILVTNNTTPEFVPIMRKAAAIVTEQGGITSHAAVLSRELGMPCIIGVRDATRVLKTGDRIEVDADRGVIKILK